jgi:simple sugar transport system permease protein
LTYFVLFKTTHGLKIRAVGENPRAADVLGINVGLTRYLTLIFAAIMQSVAGAYLLMAETAVFTPGMIGGRGWITLQLVMFGRWNPPLILGGAVLFSFIEALAYKVQLLYRMIPYQFLLMMPYIATIVTLVLISRGAVMPRMLGVPYKREKSE